MARNTHLLVGYDGSAESEHALRWAVDEARRRRLPLTLCHAWRWPYPATHLDHEGQQIVQRMGRHILEHGATLAAAQAPNLKIETRLPTGPAYVALLRAAEDAEMIVIGSHSDDALPVGSTALQLPARAHRPVVVVREPAQPAGHRRIVVGVDGSAGGDVALRFAFEEAAVRGWRLRAVCGRGRFAPDGGDLFGHPAPGPAEPAELERVWGAGLQRAVAPWREKYPQVEAETRLVAADPREALLTAAQEADLVVVGDRGTGGLHPMLLGSTTLAVLQHAPCSVAIVEAGEGRRS